MHLWRRALPTFVVAALAVGLSAPATADPEPTTTIASTTWGYLDRAATSARIDPEGNAPLGHWRRGHVARSFFTFPLEAATGFTSAALTGREVSGRCDRRAVEVWRTDPLRSTHSFANPPRAHEKLADLGPAASCASISVDVTAALHAAVGRAETSVTVELRVPAPKDAWTTHARVLASDLSLVLTPDDNTPPDVPTDPRVLHPDLGCATEAPGTYLNPASLNDAGEVILSAALTDPDPGDALTAEFTRWPIADPTARASVRFRVQANGRATGQAVGLFEAEGSYAWTARALDGVAQSVETAPCYLTVDRTRPADPVVSSAVYPPGSDPSGGVGVPGEFSFTSSPDVVAFDYRWGGNGDFTTVPADAASVALTPVAGGSHSLAVTAVDRAGNRSPEFFYRFTVRETRPTVFSPIYHEDSVNGGIGVAGRFDFTATLPDAVGFTYRFGDGPEITVAAVDRKAAIDFTPARGGVHVLVVRSVDSAGAASPAREYRFSVDDRPRLTRTGDDIVGSPMTFALSPRLPATVSYTYRFDYWEGEDEGPVTIPANADGTATFTWTPTRATVSSFHVYSTDGSGVRSLELHESMYVNGAAPQVARTGANTPIEPGTLRFTTAMANPVEYEYGVAGSPERFTAAAGQDGSAVVAFNPTARGYIHLVVRARNAAGVWTSWGGTTWWVTDYPGVASAEFPAGRESPLRPGAFTLTPNQAGAVAFDYSIDNVPGTVAIGPDGTARVEWTPPAAGWHFITVSSRTASGVASERRSYSFTIVDGPDGRPSAGYRWHV